jgi:hypothetical protein
MNVTSFTNRDSTNQHIVFVSRKSVFRFQLKCSNEYSEKLLLTVLARMALPRYWHDVLLSFRTTFYTRLSVPDSRHMLALSFW